MFTHPKVMLSLRVITSNGGEESLASLPYGLGLEKFCDTYNEYVIEKRCFHTIAPVQVFNFGFFFLFLYLWSILTVLSPAQTELKQALSCLTGKRVIIERSIAP